MQIRVERIPEAGLTLEECLVPSDHAGLIALEEAEALRFEETVRARVHFLKSSGMIEADGRISALIETECSRCLEPFTSQVEGEFALTFAPVDAVAEDEAVAEAELTHQDLGLAPYDGESIDLTPYLVEQVLLMLPAHPVCREDCAGLCSRCGQNLNEGPCGCSGIAGDSPFAKLKDLKLD